MKRFEEYIESGDVRTGSPSPSEAESLREQAKHRFQEEIEKAEMTESNATFKFESAYEALRQFLQSFLAGEGYKPYSHEAIIAYAHENGLLTDGEADRLDRFRKLRNDIKYRGETANLERAEAMIELARSKLQEDIE